MEYYKENRGSEWRKWDLHVHTPESGLNNGFGENWDLYVKTLFSTAIKNEVAVLGVTDYFTIDGYEKLCKEYLKNDAKLLQLFDNDPVVVAKIKQILVLPNIEFRLKQAINGNRINYHVIFSNEVDINDIKDNFLREIRITRELYPDGEGDIVKISRHNIEEFGKKIRAEQPSFKGSDFSIGCKTAIVDEEDIRNALINKKMFKDKYIIVIPPDEDLSEIEWSKQDHQIRKLFIQHCHAFFTSNKNTIAFALGEKHPTKKEYLKEFKTFKPCYIGCDAHSIKDIEDKLGVYSDEKRCKTTWIEADTTFLGLLQTIFEPELRVRIQAGKPDVKSARNIISSISLTDAEGKFSTNKILLNGNLNSIIGGKSSGKTLLLHSLALAVDATQVERISEKLNIAGYHKLNFDLHVEWADGRKDSLSKLSETGDEGNRKVTYIPQLYINYLAERNNKEDLNKLILNILLQNTNFAAFYAIRKSAILQLNQTITNNVSLMIQKRREAFSFYNQIKEHGWEKDILKSIQTIEAQIKELEKNLSLTEQEKLVYNAFKKKETALLVTISQLNQYIQTEQDIESCASQAIENLVGSIDEHGILHGGDIETRLSYYPDIPDKFKKHFDDYRQRIYIAGSTIISSFEALGYKKALDEANKQLLQEKKSVEAIQKKVDGQTELKKANENLIKEKQRLATSKELNNKMRAALDIYRSLQKTISEDLVRRNSCYSEVVQEINNSHSQMPHGISLEASILAKTDRSDFYTYVNKNKIPNNHPFNAIYLENGSTDITKLPALFADIKTVKDSSLILNTTEVVYPLNQDVGIEGIFKNLVTDIAEYNFEVKYKNDSLFDMSPGKKGTVLLLLFLELNSSEYPILIDQPEDNLDNRTIYDLLCKMIRTKKKERQIILISHNANIVVATDSENIIVANQRGQNETEHNNQYRFEYVNGSLETSFDQSSDKTLSDLDSKGIRQHVCDILEGGDEAFLEREQKYSIKKYE